MKAIQKIKKSLKTTKKVLRGIFGAYERDRRSASPVTTGASDSVSEKHLLGGITFVLRHGLFSGLLNLNTLPWRSRTSGLFTTHSLSTHIRNVRLMRISGVASSFLLGLLALATLVPLYNVVGTEDTEAASDYVPSTSSITFTSTRNTATINLTPTSTNGTFVQSDTTNTSEVASFNVTTDNATGYTLGIASSTDTTNLTNGTDTLSTISNTSGITADTFNTSTYNDMWGYLPSKYNSTANTGSSAKFYPMTTETTTLDETAIANSTANTYTIALGARVTMGKSSGNYTTPSGTAFVLTAVGKPASYSITYNQNTTDSVSNLPGPTGVQSTSAHSITLSGDMPTRTGYDFLGWCTKQTSDQTTQSNGSTACTNAGGIYYSAGGDFYIDETTTNITTLYAIWYLKDITVTGVFGGSGVTGITFANQTYGDKSITTNNETTTLKYGASYTITGTYSSGYEFSSWSATAGSLGSTTTASTTYSTTNVATLTLTGKSSKLWFQNATSEDCGKTMYDNRSNDTYKNIAYTTKKIGSLCWMTRNLDLPGGTALTSDDTNLTNGFTLPASSTSGFSSQNTDYVYNSSSTYNDTSCGNNNPCYSYYSFYTATAHWGTSSVSSGNSSVDICPKGWRLPTRAEYDTLVSSYNTGAKLTTSPFYGVYSGLYRDGSFLNGGSYGYYWSSTVYDANSAYNLYFRSSSAYTSYDGKNFGFAVRCVAKPRYNVTIATTNNATGIVIDGTIYSNGDTVSLFEGDHIISGTYASGYYFDSWSITSGGTLGSTTSRQTTLTIAGDVTLTLTGGSKLWFQDASSANCGSTMYDRRGNNTYKNIAYTTAKIGSLCWMTRNLDLPGGTALSQSDSNLNGSTTSYTLPASSTSGFSDYSTAYVYNSSSTYNDTSCGSGNPCYSYYSYAAATAGTNPSSGAASSDICPYGWRLPTKAEYDTLVSSYNTGPKLVASPFYGVYSGYYNYGSFRDGGSLGGYWSSTAYVSSYAHRLDFNGSSAGTYYDYNYYGFAVRCVAKSRYNVT